MQPVFCGSNLALLVSLDGCLMRRQLPRALLAYELIIAGGTTEGAVSSHDPRYRSSFDRHWYASQLGIEVVWLPASLGMTRKESSVPRGRDAIVWAT